MTPEEHQRMAQAASIGRRIRRYDPAPGDYSAEAERRRGIADRAYLRTTTILGAHRDLYALHVLDCAVWGRDPDGER